jgi:hypothetical protein
MRIKSRFTKRGRYRLEIAEFGSDFHVGYWDGATGDRARDFRSLGIRHNREEAHRLYLDILKKDGRYY